jgi:cell division protein FtsQ
VKVRSRTATRQRNRRVLAFFSALILLCGAVGGAWYGARYALRHFFWRNPDYNLAAVDIHTDGSLTREQILDATKIEEGKNIFAINLSVARKGLMALPQVDRAEIERVLPNRISIDIAERKPVAWVSAKDDVDPSADPSAFLIDRDGILMRVKTPVRDYFHLPLICGLDVDNYEEGGAVDLPEMKAALQLIRLTNANPARYQVRAIDISKGYCIEVTDDRHAKVTFPLDGLDAQLDRLTLLYASVDNSNREIQTVNLLVQRNIPVTFVPPPGPDPSSDDAAASPSPSPALEALPSPAGNIPVKRAQPVHKSAHHTHAYGARRETATVPPQPYY